ncbi:MAG: ABC transporter permease [Candidatus Marinimicrobia bacterium]|nr:ABC transporter permease [Candidatus Neomarinimicrobiota bacterium]
MYHIEESILTIEGTLNRENIPELDNFLKKYMRKKGNILLQINLSKILKLDSAGAIYLRSLERKQNLELLHLSDTAAGVLSIFSSESMINLPEPAQENIFVRIGEYTLDLLSLAWHMLILCSDIFTAAFFSMFNTKGRKKGSIINQAVILGVDAFGIIALLSFIIGVILAMQSAAQLRQFGAGIFVADLIAVSMVREMGPMMTAIIVAGRSGSAIASEIATMKVSEELDALKMMALDPVYYVIAPKFLALSYTMPMLVMISMVVGILGGLTIGITYLDLSVYAYILESFYFLTLEDLFVGLSKSVVFAWVIVIISSFFGLRAEGGSEGVGRSTTSSVVVSIFAVIVLDAIFSLIFLV